MKNVGKLDQMIRLVLGCALLFIGGQKPGLMMWVFSLLGLIVLYTAWTRTCPLYDMLGCKGPKTSRVVRAAPKRKAARKRPKRKAKKRKRKRR